MPARSRGYRHLVTALDGTCSAANLTRRSLMCESMDVSLSLSTLSVSIDLVTPQESELILVLLSSLWISLHPQEPVAKINPPMIPRMNTMICVTTICVEYEARGECSNCRWNSPILLSASTSKDSADSLFSHSMIGVCVDLRRVSLPDYGCYRALSCRMCKYE